MQLDVVCTRDERDHAGMIMANVGMPSPPILVGSAISDLVIPDFTLRSPRRLSSWPDIAASTPRTYASDAASLTPHL